MVRAPLSHCHASTAKPAANRGIAVAYPRRGTVGLPAYMRELGHCFLIPPPKGEGGRAQNPNALARWDSVARAGGGHSRQNELGSGAIPHPVGLRPTTLPLRGRDSVAAPSHR